MYALAEIYATLLAPGGLAHEAVATVIVLINCACLGLGLELLTDPVPILVLNQILDGKECKHGVKVIGVLKQRFN